MVKRSKIVLEQVGKRDGIRVYRVVKLVNLTEPHVEKLLTQLEIEKMILHERNTTIEITSKRK